MGFPLGVTFANYYVCHLEDFILDTNPDFKPMDCRYIDDIFIITDTIDNLFKLKKTFQDSYVSPSLTE